MIYSGFDDNWNRVEIMHSIAQKYLDNTRGSDYRRRTISGGPALPFDTEAYESMRKESQIVSMIMAWSVIALESLINHALAATINNKHCAISAIEYPRQVLEKSRSGNNAKSELAKKIVILNDDIEPSIEILRLCDKLSQIRNSVVHDKPFSMFDLGDGEIEISYFKSRGDDNESIYYYDSLISFFRECDKLLVHVIERFLINDLPGCDRRFTSLLNREPTL